MPTNSFRSPTTTQNPFHSNSLKQRSPTGRPHALCSTAPNSSTAQGCSTAPNSGRSSAGTDPQPGRPVQQAAPSTNQSARSQLAPAPSHPASKPARLIQLPSTAPTRPANQHRPRRPSEVAASPAMRDVELWPSVFRRPRSHRRRAEP
ncbi:hypothetical protein FB565_004476 [Actinoplanes lutulentus]|nr:hypothetical protein [Actinoplanes lutulentus]